MRNFIRKIIMGDDREYYLEGYDAFGLGYIPVDCPYHDGSYAYAQWMLGYEHAEEECPVYADCF